MSFGLQFSLRRGEFSRAMVETHSKWQQTSRTNQVIGCFHQLKQINLFHLGGIGIYGIFLLFFWIHKLIEMLHWLYTCRLAINLDICILFTLHILQEQMQWAEEQQDPRRHGALWRERWTWPDCPWDWLYGGAWNTTAASQYVSPFCWKRQQDRETWDLGIRRLCR